MPLQGIQSSDSQPMQIEGVDPLVQKVYEGLLPGQGDASEDVVMRTAGQYQPLLLRPQAPVHNNSGFIGNLALLIRYKTGPDIDPSRVSVASYTTRMSNGVVHGQKMAVVVHDGPGNARIVASREVNGEGRSAVAGFAREVDGKVASLVEIFERQAHPLVCPPS